MTSDEVLDHLIKCGMESMIKKQHDGSILLYYPQSHRVESIVLTPDVFSKFNDIQDIWYNLFYLAQYNGEKWANDKIKNRLGLY